MNCQHSTNPSRMSFNGSLVTKRIAVCGSGIRVQRRMRKLIRGSQWLPMFLEDSVLLAYEELAEEIRKDYPRIQVTLSPTNWQGGNDYKQAPVQTKSKIRTASPVTVIAGLDTYTTHSIMSLQLLQRIQPNAVPSPPIDGDRLTFMNGDSTAILGTFRINVTYLSPNALTFLIVRTVDTHLIGADILLGTDFMSVFKEVTFRFRSPQKTLTYIVNAMGVKQEILDGKDFTLTRRPDGHWSVLWKWLIKPPRQCTVS